jgi:hypothetical protein
VLWACGRTGWSKKDTTGLKKSVDSVVSLWPCGMVQM